MSDCVYQWLDGVEDLELYSKGGYYPITILDTVQSPRTSYRVLHKLGYGSYSTVWLAQDTQTSRLVSLKLSTTEPDAAEGSNEMAMLAHLAAAPRSESEIPARQYIVPLLDSFQVESPNGSHTCLVMEPQGPSIFALRYESEANRLPGHVARKLVPQLASAMAYLHSRGIVHGDLHTKNILFRVPSLSTWTPEEVTARLEVPVMKPIKRVDGGSLGPSAPETVVRPCNPRRFLPFCLEDPKLCVTDFGEAFFAAERKPSRELHTALSVASPEILLEDWDQVGSHSDVWALACTMFEILADHRLFEAPFDEPEEVLLEIVSALKGADNFPEKWKYKFPELEQPNRDLKDRVAGLIRSEDAEDRFQGEELQALTVLLEKMLKYEPRERIPAAEVVERLPEEWKCT